MKKKKNNIKKKPNFRSNKIKNQNQCTSSQKFKDDINIKNTMKLLLESSEKKTKNKNTFSFVKSYLINFKDNKNNKNKNRHSVKDKNIITEKQKLKNEKFNKSTNDINKYKITSPRNNYCENNTKSNNNQKIEILKNKIYNLMNIIDNFEINFIKDKTPFLIKEKFDKIKHKVNPIPLKLNINCFNNNNHACFNENFSKTERINYNSKNKKINGRQHSAVNIILSSEKNIAMILLNKQKQLNNNKNFLKLINTNLTSKNDIKKINSNLKKNKSKSLVNKIKLNSNSNQIFYKNDNLDEKEKKKNIFKRRINYSNFINQKMKQNIIIHRNKGSFYKQNNIANKSKFSNNSNNGCKTCFDLNHNDNYVKNLLNKNNKSKSIDKSDLNSVNNLNNINI
jgi:hypothetical protein